jgi:Cu(I)/Ag(I) efflux system membrane fusion protein
MKNLIVVLLLVGLVSFCGKKTSEPPKVTSTPISELLDAYLDLKDALVTSNPENIAQPEKLFAEAIAKVDTSAMSAEQHSAWIALDFTIKANVDIMLAAEDVEAKRVAFSPISNAMFEAVKVFGNDGRPLFQQYCPMAFNDKGAYWLSRQKLIANPYFGNKMLRCGSVAYTF